MDDDYVDDQDYEKRIKPTLTNKYLTNNDESYKDKNFEQTFYKKYLLYKKKYLNLKNN